MSSETASKIRRYFNEYAYALPDKEEKHLVHADFDPANILVDKINGSWCVSGILDWEFSFSGSVLCDVANMLRYAHEMPPASYQSYTSRA